MKEFLYQFFSNPIQKTKWKPFSKPFWFCIHIYFSIFLSSGYENILRTSSIYHLYTTHTQSSFLPPEGGVLPLLWRGVWFEVFKNNPHTTQILISYPPPKFFVFILWKPKWKWFEKSFCKSDTETKNKMKKWVWKYL